MKRHTCWFFLVGIRTQFFFNKMNLQKIFKLNKKLVVNRIIFYKYCFLIIIYLCFTCLKVNKLNFMHDLLRINVFCWTVAKKIRRIWQKCTHPHFDVKNFNRNTPHFIFITVIIFYDNDYVCNYFSFNSLTYLHESLFLRLSIKTVVTWHFRSNYYY